MTIEPPARPGNLEMSVDQPVHTVLALVMLALSGGALPIALSTSTQ
jgi:hypothetical protein